MSYHKCLLNPRNTSKDLVKQLHPRLRCCQRKWQCIVLLELSNPICSSYFRSELEMRKEKVRQLNCAHRWVIHPLSKFRMYYEMWLCFLYTWAILQKSIDGAYAYRKIENFPHYRKISFMCDVLSWIDIFINFFTGYVVPKRKVVELKLSKIARHYVFGPYFICDLVSSFPKNAIYWITDSKNNILRGVVNIALFFKIIRLVTVLHLFDNMHMYFNIKKTWKSTIFKASFCLGIFIHYTGCMTVSLVVIIDYYFAKVRIWTSWIYAENLYWEYWLRRYLHATFRSATYVFGTNLNLVYKLTSEIDIIVNILFYFLGKVVLMSLIIISASFLLSSRQNNAKYHSRIGELKAYLRYWESPIDLQNRILEFCRYKYQRKYFEEKSVMDMLSDSLKSEINLHLSKTLIANVGLFADFDEHQLSALVNQMKSEFYMAGDAITQAGHIGYHMYFIESGTVAVYTHSGKEICHLQDGAYFGEMCILWENSAHLATVTALEVCQIWKLSKTDFQKYLAKNKKLFKKILKTAEDRFKLYTEIEIAYKKELFSEEHQVTE